MAYIFWARWSGEGSTVGTAMASGGDEPVRWVGEKGPGKGGTLESEREGEPGVRGDARGVQAVEGASKQGGGGARVRACVGHTPSSS